VKRYSETLGASVEVAGAFVLDEGAFVRSLRLLR
jgi:hypothetical protein